MLFFTHFFILITAIVRAVSCVVEFSPAPIRPVECRGNSTTNATVKADENQVSELFLSKFGSYQRPRYNWSESVVANISFVLYSITDVLERERIIKLSGYLAVRWMDEFRVWKDVSPYNCVEYVVLPSTEIWLPDIAIMNADDRYVLMGKEKEKVRVYSNGLTFFSPGGTIEVYCEYDLKMFPFDVQTCSIELESWRYTHQHMEFQFFSPLTLKYFRENEQWEYLGTSQTVTNYSYAEAWNKFDHATFTISIRRKVLYYLMNVIIPSILIAVAQLATFTIPVGEVEKVSISFTCLLAYSVFQIMVIGDMPRSSDNIPMLSIYIDLQMGYIAAAMLGEGLSFFFLDKIDQTGLNGYSTQVCPLWLFEIASIFGTALCLRHKPPSHYTVNQLFSMNNLKAAVGRFASENANGTHPVQEAEVEVEIATVKEADSSSEYRGSRNKKTRRAEKANRLHGKGDDRAHSAEHGHHIKLDLRQLQWQYVSNVTERVVLVVYALAITMTPIVMFGIYPLTVYKKL